MQIKIRQLNIFLFALYNMTYVLYMTKHVSRNIYLATLGMFFIVAIYECMKFAGTKKYRFFKPFVLTLGVAALFFLISITIQILNGSFQLYVIEELLYFIVPVLIAFVCINFNRREDCKIFFYIILVRSILYFILRFWGTISLASILSISFIDSNSSIYEIVLAHEFLFLMIIFLYLNDMKASIISFVFCVLSFKRLPFLLAFFILGGALVGKFGRGIGFKSLTNKFVEWLNDRFSNKTIFVLFCIVLILPFVMLWVYSVSGVEWFLSNFNIELNKITSGRVNIVNYALQNCQFNGLGSTTNFFERSSLVIYRMVANMHCDVIRLTKEVTIVGYAVYVFILFKVFKKTRLLMLLLIYLIVEMTVSHMADSLNIWIMFYLFAAYIYTEPQKNDSNYEIKENK